MNYELIIIGGGPAGYPAAAEAVRQGLKTLLIERAEAGGTCLNRGCIPTKTLCRSAEVALTVADAARFGIDTAAPCINLPKIIERKNEVVTQLREGVVASLKGVDILHADARIVRNDDGNIAVTAHGETYCAPRIVIATGAAPALLPIPGADLCMTSDALLNLTELPASMVIIGGGVIGMEFASIFASFGCEVTVVEYCKEILPGFDKDIAKRLRTALSQRGVKFTLNAAATAVKPSENGLTVEYEAKGKPGAVEAEKVLMAVGRKAVVPEGFVEAGGAVGRRGIEVDENYQTGIPGVYAIGDCNGICQLAHAATAQAMRLMGVATDLSPIPAAVFTIPEAAMTGMTEEYLKEHDIPYKAVKLPVRANGKALAMGETDGLVKILIATDPTTDPVPATATAADSAATNLPPASAGQILGAHILGPHASDLIMELSLAISADLPASAILRAIHPHPTLSELIPSALNSK